MVKKQLKKQIGAKRRNAYRDYLEFLDIVKEDIESGDTFSETFGPRLPDDDEALGLASEFKRSGLDHTLPGHWQFLLVAKSNFLGRQPTRVVTDWTREDEIKFLSDLREQRRDEKPISRMCLCGRLKKAMKEQYPQHAGSLRQRLQDILREWKALRETGELPDEEVKLLQMFEEDIARNRSEQIASKAVEKSDVE